jgi:hypothetical protein
MNEEARMAALDARLRQAMSGLDAGAGFHERLQARIAAAAPRANEAEVLERRRAAVRRRLQREAWANGISVAGLGLAAIAAVWRFAPEIGQFFATTADAADSPLIGAITLAVLAAGLWPLLRRMPEIRIG